MAETRPPSTTADAAEAADRAVAMAPGDPFARLAAARVATARNDRAAARTHLDAAQQARALRARLGS